jgi:hypothetical protein
MDKRIAKKDRPTVKAVTEFCAWLSTRPGTLEVGNTHDCVPLIQAIGEWLKLIGVIQSSRKKN